MIAAKDLPGTLPHTRDTQVKRSLPSLCPAGMAASRPSSSIAIAPSCTIDGDYIHWLLFVDGTFLIPTVSFVHGRMGSVVCRRHRPVIACSISKWS